MFKRSIRVLIFTLIFAVIALLLTSLRTSTYSESSNATYEWANIMWSTVLEGASSNSITGLGVDSNGNLFVSGALTSLNLDFDPGPGTDPHSSAQENRENIYLSKFSADDQYLWTFTVGGVEGEVPQDMEVTPNGEVYMGGTYSSESVDFDPSGGTAILTNDAGSRENIFLQNMTMMEGSNGREVYMVSKRRIDSLLMT